MEKSSIFVTLLAASVLLTVPNLAHAAAAHKPTGKTTAGRKAVKVATQPKTYTVETVPLPTATRPLIVQWMNTRGEMVSDIYFDGYGCGEQDSSGASIISSATGEQVGRVSLCYGKITTYDTKVPLPEFKTGINSNAYTSTIGLNKINETQIFRLDDYDERNAFDIRIFRRVQAIRDAERNATQTRQAATTHAKAAKPSQRTTAAPTARDILLVSDLLNEELRGKERTDTPGILIVRSTLGGEIAREYRSVENVNCTKVLPVKFRCSYTINTHPVATDENSLFGMAYSLTAQDTSSGATNDYVLDGGKWSSPTQRAAIEDEIQQRRDAKNREQNYKWDDDQRKFSSCLRDASTCGY